MSNGLQQGNLYKTLGTTKLILTNIYFEVLPSGGELYYIKH